MISCKLCNTTLSRKNLRKDGSMLCPVCGQIYWRIAVERAMDEAENKTQNADKKNIAAAKKAS